MEELRRLVAAVFKHEAKRSPDEKEFWEREIPRWVDALRVHKDNPDLLEMMIYDVLLIFEAAKTDATLRLIHDPLAGTLSVQRVS